MEEIREVLKKYDEAYISTNLHSVDDINKFANTFYKDVAELFSGFFEFCVAEGIGAHPCKLVFQRGPLILKIRADDFMHRPVAG